jgi:hypothetical protein
MIVYEIYHNKSVCNITMGEIQLKWVANEACNNVRSCKITTTPAPTPIKNVDQKEHVKIHLKP